jgi:hypothetical protein
MTRRNFVATGTTMLAWSARRAAAADLTPWYRRNSLRGPGYFDVDVAVTREFKLYEQLTLQARAEAFNVLNHPNFMLPNGNISSAAFGQITTAFDPRILQASMKLIF